MATYSTTRDRIEIIEADLKKWAKSKFRSACMIHLGSVLFVISNFEKMKPRYLRFSINHDRGRFYISAQAGISLKYISINRMLRITVEFKKRYQVGADLGNFKVKEFESLPERGIVKIELEFPDLVIQRARRAASRSNWQSSTRIPSVVVEVATKLKRRHIYNVKKIDQNTLLIYGAMGPCKMKFSSIRARYINIHFELPPSEFFLNEFLRVVFNLFMIASRIDDFRVHQHRVCGARDAGHFDVDEKHWAGEIHDILLERDI